MHIRKANLADLDTLTAIEAACFPAAEAASRESFENRLKVYPDYFWVIEENSVVMGFLNGPVIDQNIIEDEMFADATCHNPDGEWQTVFGINTLPEYRRRGLGKLMMQAMIDTAKAEGRRGCVLTCKDKLVHYYGGCGFVSLGVSQSTHGGAVWNDMVLEF